MAGTVGRSPSFLLRRAGRVWEPQPHPPGSSLSSPAPAQPDGATPKPFNSPRRGHVGDANASDCAAEAAQRTEQGSGDDAVPEADGDCVCARARPQPSEEVVDVHLDRLL